MILSATADTAAKPALSKRQRSSEAAELRAMVKSAERQRKLMEAEALAAAERKAAKRGRKRRQAQKSSAIAEAMEAIRAKSDVRERKRRAARSPRWTDTREPVEVLRDAGLLQPREAKAGSRLYAEWVMSGGLPKSTFNWGRLVALVQTSGGEPGSPIDARNSVTKALRAVGIILSPILVHVCLLPQMLPADEKELKMLKEALKALADHYDQARSSIET